MTKESLSLTSIQEARRDWAQEHRRWIGESRVWIRQLLLAEDYQFGYFCPSLREIKEQLLLHLQEILDHEADLEDPDLALRGFDLEASERLKNSHREAGRRHALQRHLHEVLGRRVESSLD
jgi:hypothetical protein